MLVFGYGLYSGPFGQQQLFGMQGRHMAWSPQFKARAASTALVTLLPAPWRGLLPDALVAQHPPTRPLSSALRTGTTGRLRGVPQTGIRVGALSSRFRAPVNTPENHW